jgi:RNA polymerase sigma factor (TIGR02999 family)
VASASLVNGSEISSQKGSTILRRAPFILDATRPMAQNRPAPRMLFNAKTDAFQCKGPGLSDRSTDELIAKWRAGDADALQRLLPLIYEELRRVASKHLRAERADHTLQTTALIHEAYLRLVGGEGAQINDHCHFVALASRLMRQVLVDHARARLAAKRQGGIKVTLSEALDVSEQKEVDLLAIDDALGRLAQFDPQQAQVVELRFFGGLSIVETSQAMSVSSATVKRDWTTARAWLRRELERAAES